MATAPQHIAQTPTDAQAPRKPYVLGTWLAYNPDETLAQFFVRKKAALAAGDQAWREGKIKAHHQKIYERLVDAVGAHQYSWIKVETLAAEFNADESTVKRWLAVLEKKANLIRRQRQFKTASRTYVVVYDQYQALTPGGDQAAPETHDTDTEQPNEPEAAEPEAANTASADNDTPHADGAPEEASDSEAVFFERNDAPTYSAFVPPQIKDLPLNTSCHSSSGVNTRFDPSGVNGGGEKHTFDITNIDADIRAIIADEAINTINGQQIVAARPLNELRAVQGYLDKQTNVRDRAGLFVWLNERQFGAELLAGRVRAAEQQSGVPAAPSTPQRRRQRAPHSKQAQQQSQVDQYSTVCAACGERAVFLCNINDPFCEHCGVRPGDEWGKDDGLTPDPTLWQAVLARLNIAQADRNVWLTPTMLAHYDDVLVLACPHKRVRTMIRMYYLDHIRAVAGELLGRPVQLETTVTYMPDVTAEQRAAWLSAAEPQPCEATWDTNALPSRTADVLAPHEPEQIDIVPTATTACTEPFTQAVQHAGAQEADLEPLHEQPREDVSRETYQRVEKIRPAGRGVDSGAVRGQNAAPAVGRSAISAPGSAPAEGFSTGSYVSLPSPSLSEVWSQVYNDVAIPLGERRTWLEPTYLLRINEDHATVCAPNVFVRNRLATHYHDQLAATLSAVVGRPIRVEVVTESSGVGRRR